MNPQRVSLAMVGLVAVSVLAACGANDAQSNSSSPSATSVAAAPPVATASSVVMIPVEPDGGIGDGAGPIPGYDDGHLPEQLLEQLPDSLADGLPASLEEYTETAKQLGYDVRVVRRDGIDLDVNDDLDHRRINVDVKNGNVVGVIDIG